MWPAKRVFISTALALLAGLAGAQPFDVDAEERFTVAAGAGL